MIRAALILVTLAAVALTAGLVKDAGAHEGQIQIGCDGVTFSFVKFEAETNLVHETVNGVTTGYTFAGPESTNTLPLPEGATTVTASASWDGQTIPDGPVTVELDCDEPPPVEDCPPGQVGHPIQDRAGNLVGFICSEPKTPPTDKPPVLEPPAPDCPTGFSPWKGKCYRDEGQEQPDGTVIYGQSG